MTEIEAFAAHFRLLGQSEHALEGYVSVLRRLAKTVALDQATPFDLRSYLAERTVEEADAVARRTRVRTARGVARRGDPAPPGSLASR